MTDARPPWERPGATLLVPLSWPLRAAVAARRAAYRSGLLQRRDPVLPVVSIGGLTVGGAGKTPMVHWLARQALEAGVRVAIVSRGYGGEPGPQAQVVSDGKGGGTHDPVRVGDEPVWLAQALPEAIVVVHPDRARACARARELGAQLVLLDDGLQHARLERDLDVVLLDARAPLGNGRFVPAGPLRDSPAAARDAHVVVLTRRELATDAQIEAATALAHRIAPRAVVGTASHRIVGAVSLVAGTNGSWRTEGPVQPLAGRRVFAVSAIARPDDFVAALRDVGAEVVGSQAWPDHHRFAPAEIESAHAAAGEAALITTFKDSVRLPVSEHEFLCAQLEIDVEPRVADELRARLVALVARQ